MLKGAKDVPVNLTAICDGLFNLEYASCACKVISLGDVADYANFLGFGVGAIVASFVPTECSGGRGMWVYSESP